MNANAQTRTITKQSSTHIKALQNIFTTHCNNCKDFIHSTSTYSELYIMVKTKQKKNTQRQNKIIIS
jgi:hypothetical protein